MTVAITFPQTKTQIRRLKPPRMKPLVIALDEEVKCNQEQDSYRLSRFCTARACQAWTRRYRWMAFCVLFLLLIVEALPLLEMSQRQPRTTTPGDEMHIGDEPLGKQDVFKNIEYVEGPQHRPRKTHFFSLGPRFRDAKSIFRILAFRHPF